MFTIYSADVTGNPGNCSYPHKHVILDEDSLKAAICHDYVCAEYKNSYRNQQSGHLHWKQPSSLLSGTVPNIFMQDLVIRWATHHLAIK